MDRTAAIAAIRLELRNATGRRWSVRGGTGTSWGWITVTAPPSRMVAGRMSEQDAAELTELFGEPAGGAISIPASPAHYAQAVNRLRGLDTPAPAAYWD